MRFTHTSGHSLLKSHAQQQVLSKRFGRSIRAFKLRIAHDVRQGAPSGNAGAWPALFREHNTCWMGQRNLSQSSYCSNPGDA